MDTTNQPDVVAAIVHDYFTQQGGAERFVGELGRLFPDAPIHTSVYDPAVLPRSVPEMRIRATPLQGLRSLGIPLPLLAPLLPTAFGRMRFDRSAVVISSTSAFAHHVRPRAGVIHVAYCHSPPHFLWETGEYFRERPLRGRVMVPPLTLLRRADRAAARRVDAYVANSRYTADRIERTYGRRATVIHPPIDAEAFSPSAERSGRLLVVSRLRRHKRIELAIEAAARLGTPLDIIGDGPDEPYLLRLGGPTTRFLGRLTDREVQDAMARCVAMIVPATEDFGLTMAEVQAAGRPPIAFAQGGALEIIDDGETGFLFHEQSVEGLLEAIRRASHTALDPEMLVRSARRFDRPTFDAAFLGLVSRLLAEASEGSAGPQTPVRP
jgi:glycosyltransferase involved in cell wall biosynthesis